MTYFIIIFIQRFTSFFKSGSGAIISIISIFLLAVCNVALRQKNSENNQTLKQIKNARKIEEENSKLTDDELIDKL